MEPRAQVDEQRKARRNGPLRERILAQKRASYQRTKDKVRAYQTSYRAAHKLKISERDKRWRERNRARLLAAKKADYVKNKTRYNASAAAWRKRNPDWQHEWVTNNRARMRELQRQGQRRRRAEDPSFKAAAAMRSRVWALIKKGAKKDGPSGLKQAALKEWLEDRFKPGMTWENYGSAWVVDHIVPCAEFDLSNPAQLRRCFHYHNLQPLWKRDNMIKSDKVFVQAELPI